MQREQREHRAEDEARHQNEVAVRIRPRDPPYGARSGAACWTSLLIPLASFAAPLREVEANGKGV